MGLTDSVPLAGRAPTQSPDATHPLAPATDQRSVAEPPGTIADGVTVKRPCASSHS
jgi:hypothetical protein